LPTPERWFYAAKQRGGRGKQTGRSWARGYHRDGICNPLKVLNPYFHQKEINGLSSAEFKEGSTDVSLVSAIRSGDQSAMAALYDRYSGLVYAVAQRVLADTGAAEDVLQEVFMQLWRDPGVFNSSRGNLGAFLAVIARNRAIDFLRRRHPETDISTIIVSVEPDMAGEAERGRAMEKVRGALGAMPAQQRSALEMAYFEGLSHTEIAARTGEPLGTIKTRIRAGLVSLRRVFQT
jgi:RNA polymerase sigma-70 factor, ECF subfamily